MKVKDKLNEAGIKAGILKRKKSDPFLMELNHNRKSILIHEPENAKVTVKPSGNQAVLTVSEPVRSWIETIDIVSYNDTMSVEELSQEMDNKTTEEIKEILLDAFDRDLEEDFYFNTTNALNAEKQIVAFKVYKKEFETSTTGFRMAIELDVEISVPETIQHFLVGTDETHSFISQLPEKANSVKQAHKILRPDVSKDALRSGEWFFDPVTNESLIKKLLTRHAWTHTSWLFHTESVDEEGNKYWDDFSSENHEVLTLIKYKDENYASGVAYDTRNTHKPVILPSICKIVRNREVFNPGEKYD